VHRIVELRVLVGAALVASIGFGMRSSAEAVNGSRTWCYDARGHALGYVLAMTTASGKQW
jgi:hypothetical protein